MIHFQIVEMCTFGPDSEEGMDQKCICDAFPTCNIESYTFSTKIGPARTKQESQDQLILDGSR